MKRVHVYSAVIIVFLSFLFLFTACQKQKTPSQSYYRETIAKIDAHEPTGENLNKQTIAWTMEQLDGGTLEFTVADIRVVRNRNEIGDGGFTSDACLAIIDPNYKDLAAQNYLQYGGLYESVLKYPDFFDETGDFVTGYMILLEVSVKNHNATNNYKDKDGQYVPRYNNSYIFKADSILTLQDTQSGKDEFGWNLYQVSPCYYSDYGKCPEHPMGFELKPGETTSFQIGFLINNDENNIPRSPCNFIASPQAGELGNIWFDLGLQEKED